MGPRSPIIFGPGIILPGYFRSSRCDEMTAGYSRTLRREEFDHINRVVPLGPREPIIFGPGIIMPGYFRSSRCDGTDIASNKKITEKNRI